jgi:hypothetical protein
MLRFVVLVYNQAITFSNDPILFYSLCVYFFQGTSAQCQNKHVTVAITAVVFTKREKSNTNAQL